MHVYHTVSWVVEDYVHPEWKIPQEDINYLFCKPSNLNKTLYVNVMKITLYLSTATPSNSKHLQFVKMRTFLIFLLYTLVLSPFYCVIFLFRVNVALSLSLSDGTRVGMIAFAKNRHSDMSTFRTSTMNLRE